MKPGQVLDGKYLVGEALGSGAMGLVFEGQHLLLQKPVAVKVLRPELALVDEVRDRFEGEARAAAAIGHPNIVSVTDMGRTTEGEIYFVMDRLRGESLGARLERAGPLDPLTAVGVAEDVLAGLGAAHELGLIHRDIKPDNIFFAQTAGGRETARILDFGVAKALSAVGKRTKETLAGLTVGTPEYMAPEQAAGAADIDVRADLYAMGVVLYHMLAGRTPFGGEDVVQILTAVVMGNAPPLADLCPEAPDALVRVVEAAMSRDRARRPATAAAFAAALRRSVSPGEMVDQRPGTRAPAELPNVQAFDALVAPVLMDLAPKPETSGGVVEFEDHSTDGGPPLDAGPAIETAPRDVRHVVMAPPRRAEAAVVAPAPRRGVVVAPEMEVAAPTGSRRRLVVVPVVAVVGVLAVILTRGRPPKVDGTARTEGEVPAPVAGAAAPGPRKADRKVLVLFDVSPPESRLVLDGVALRANPAQLPWGEVHRVSAAAKGYETGEVEFKVDGTKTVRIVLQRVDKPGVTP